MGSEVTEEWLLDKGFKTITRSATVYYSIKLSDVAYMYIHFKNGCISSSGIALEGKDDYDNDIEFSLCVDLTTKRNVTKLYKMITGKKL